MVQKLQKSIQPDKQAEFADEKVRILLDASPDAVVIHHVNGFIETVNFQTEQLFGYTRNELIGQPLEILLPEQFREIHISHRNHYSRSPTPRPMGTGIDLYARRKNGTEFPVDISIGPLKIGGDLLFISTIRDITKKRKSEFDRIKSIRAQEQVLGMILHDLKNPLTAILMSIQIAPKILIASPEVQKWLRTIRVAAEHMNGLIHDILTLKQTEYGTLAVNKQLFEIGSLVGPILTIVAPIAERKSIQLECVIPDNELRVNCDKDRIMQVLSNLLNNGIKFTPAGGRVELRVESVHDFIKFVISDTGPGLSEEEISHLFEPYWQAKRTAQLGTGLGLSISKNIVEAHAGKIGVTSSLGQGSQFFFLLPQKIS